MGARDELNGHDPGPPHTPAGALQLLRRRARRGAAGPAVCRVRTARAGSAAHRGQDRRRLSWVTDGQCSCAAEVGTAGGCAPVRRCACALLSSRLLKCLRSSSRTSLRDSRYVNRSWRNSWWKCRRRPLLSFLRRVRRTSWWKCRRSCLSLSGFSRVPMGTCGGSSRGLRGPTGGAWAPLTPSEAPPPGYTARPGRYRNTGPG